MTENQSDVYQISLNHEQFLVEVTFLNSFLNQLTVKVREKAEQELGN